MELVSVDTKSMAALVFTLLLFLVVNWPAYKVGDRLGVPDPWLAFIPVVGPYIVIWRSIGSSAWNTLLLFIPLVGLGAAIWLAYTVPQRHGRSTAWCLWFLIPGLNIVGFWVYALTLSPHFALKPVYSLGAEAATTSDSPSHSYSGPIFKD